MIVAIDGPAGTGKSTIASRVANSAGFLYLNSGSLYRAFTWRVLKEEPGLAEAESGDHLNRRAVELADEIDLSLTRDGIIVDGSRPNNELHSPSVDRFVAPISSIPKIRDRVNAELLALAKEDDVVAEGRDMTTVVFPNAELKVFLNANLQARAKRRHRERANGATIERVRDEIARRDRIDATKAVGRLKVHPSALYIDTSYLTVDQVCDIVLRAILRQKPRNRSY